MPLYTYDCHMCGYFEHFDTIANQKDEVWHDCPGWIGRCLSSIEIIVPNIESLENECGNSYHPMTGERIEHGFWNHLVDGPRGDGYFDDRAKYKKWMKQEGLEEAGPGVAKDMARHIKEQRDSNKIDFDSQK